MSLEKAFDEIGRLIAFASAHKRPSDLQKVMMAMFAKISQLAVEVGSVRDSNRQAPVFNHLSSLAEGFPALGWVTVVE